MVLQYCKTNLKGRNKKLKGKKKKKNEIPTLKICNSTILYTTLFL